VRLAVGVAALVVAGAAATSGSLARLSEARAAASPAVEGVGNVAGCAQGPLRVSEFDMREGRYLKAPERPAGTRHEFYFARGMYSEGGPYGMMGYGGDRLGDGGPGWSIDYPSADRHMMIVASRLSNLDACEWGQPVSFADPDLRRFPFVYSLEWGRNADLSDADAAGLRGYL
jgi:Domain of unknown function (DUF4159)